MPSSQLFVTPKLSPNRQRLKSVRKFAHILPGPGTGYPDMKKKMVKPGSRRQTRVPTRVEVASRASRKSHWVPLVADHHATALPIWALFIPVYRRGRGRSHHHRHHCPPKSSMYRPGCRALFNF
jgi:hypothetical protein